MKIIKMDNGNVNAFWDLRLKLFNELNEVTEDDNIELLERETRKFYIENINDNLISFGAVVDDEIVSVGSLCLFKRVPHISNVLGFEGYILNVYTERSYRGKGFAFKIINELINYSKRNQIKRIWLDSSKDGEQLYKKTGFVKNDNNEMELKL